MVYFCLVREFLTLADRTHSSFDLFPDQIGRCHEFLLLIAISHEG